MSFHDFFVRWAGELDLDSNKFWGTVPSELGQLSSLGKWTSGGHILLHISCEWWTNDLIFYAFFWCPWFLRVSRFKLQPKYLGNYTSGTVWLGRRLSVFEMHSCWMPWWLCAAMQEGQLFQLVPCEDNLPNRNFHYNTDQSSSHFLLQSWELWNLSKDANLFTLCTFLKQKVGRTNTLIDPYLHIALLWCNI